MMNSLIRQTHFHSARNVVCFWRHWNWWACLEKFPMKSVGIVSFYRDTASAQIQLLAQWTTFLPYIISKAKVSFVSKIFPDLWNVFRFQSAISISFLNFFFRSNIEVSVFSSSSLSLLQNNQSCISDTAFVKNIDHTVPLRIPIVL